MKRHIILGIVLFFTWQLFSYAESHLTAITDLVSCYKRHYTVLEIGNGSCEYLMELTNSSSCHGIAMLLQSSPNDLIAQVEATRPTQVSVLAPPKAFNRHA